MSSLSQFLKTSTMFGPSGFPYLPGQDVFGSGHFQIIAASGNFTVPPSVTAAGIRVRVHGAAGSGGAASNTSPGTKATGGAGGGLAVKIILGLSVGATIVATVGLGGAAVAAGSGTATAGNAGQSSSFGAYCSATGGAGGNAHDRVAVAANDREIAD